jgi:hypothetical protein
MNAERSRQLTARWFVAVLSCVGCDVATDSPRGPDASSDASMSSRVDANSPEGGPASEPTCTTRRDPCGLAGAVRPPKVRLQAAEFGPEARFAAFGEGAVLVAVDASRWRVAYVADSLQEEVHGAAVPSWPLPAVDRVGVDVTSGHFGEERRAFLLACREDHSGCTLLSVSVFAPNAPLTQWTDEPLPSTFYPVGLAFDSTSDEPRVCAFGNGIYCSTGGEWTLELESEHRLRAVVFHPRAAVAVGDAGTVFRRGRRTPWRREGGYGTESLAAVSVTALTVAVAGGPSAWIASEQVSDFCVEGDERIVGVWTPSGAETGSTDFAVFTRAGDWLSHRREDGSSEFCVSYHGQLLIGPLLGVEASPCGLSENLRLFGESAVVGEYDCIVE